MNIVTQKQWQLLLEGDYVQVLLQVLYVDSLI